MHKVLALSPLLLLLAACSTDSTPSGDFVRSASALAYPQAGRGDQVDDYHGTRVADPYRWLERVDDAQTRQWVSCGECARAAVSRRDSGARGDQEAADGAVELRALRHSREARRALLLFPQRRLAEPERAVRCGQPAGAAARAARSEHAEQGRDRCARRDRAEPGRQGAGVQPVGRRHRLAHLAFPRGGDRPRSARRAALHQVRGRRLDRGFAHRLLRALSVARRRLRRRHEAARSLLAQDGRRAGCGRARVQGRRPSDAQSVCAGHRRRPLPGHLDVRRLAADRHLLPDLGAGRLAVQRSRAPVRHVRRRLRTSSARSTTPSTCAPPRTRRMRS